MFVNVLQNIMGKVWTLAGIILTPVSSLTLLPHNLYNIEGSLSKTVFFNTFQISIWSIICCYTILDIKAIVASGQFSYKTNCSDLKVNFIFESLIRTEPSVSSLCNTA